MLDLANNSRTVLSPGLQLRYGTEWSWSPDSTKIAYFREKSAGGNLGVLDVKNPGKSWTIKEPNFKYTSERFPLWDSKGQTIYAADGQDLWKVSLKTRKPEVAGRLKGWDIKGFYTTSTQPDAWLKEGAGVLSATKSDSNEAGILLYEERQGKISLIKSMGDQPVSVSTYRTRITPDHECVILSTYGAQNPGKLLTLNLNDSRIQPLADPNPGLKADNFGQRRVLKWNTAEGKILKGVLLLPPDYQGGRLPTLLNVYGGTTGTWAKDTFGLGYYPVFNFEVLASRGYAVFEPEIPTSKGTPAKDIVSAISSACDHLVREGYSDPDRFGLMGQSYGSYTVLCALVKDPRFKAAVLTGAIVFPDLFTGYASDPGYFVQGQGKIGVTPWENREVYLENSPFFEFDQIQTPILIGQGKEDSPHFSELLFNSLKSLNKAVELRLYSDEDHVISKPQNVKDFWERRLRIFEKNL